VGQIQDQIYMGKSIFSIVFLFIAFLTFVHGQSIEGQVFAEGEEEPLIGAAVVVKNTNVGVGTDIDGKFSIPYKGSFPVILEVSYLGFGTQEVTVYNTNEFLRINLTGDNFAIEEVVVKGQRISDKQKAAPLTVESMDLLAIKEAASDNFYDALGTLKGVDLTAASLGFKVINTRGFNSTSPVRSLQIIDGVDNQAPGLNFSLGNFLGSSELDVVKVDIIVGASSAFYGPNAFNGVISMETKNPFYHQGLSAMTKVGERSLFETAFRWAEVFKNKNGKDWFAYKINFSYLRAYDWEADNTDPVFDTRNGRENPGGYDAVNVYGDEYFPLLDYTTNTPWNYPGFGSAHRTGYREVDLVDYNTRNTKANAAFHFRTRPNLMDASPEFIVASNVGSGTTVYQGDNRFSLRNILFFQNRLEFRKRDKYFIRAYATNEDAGDSYDPYFTALRLQEEAKSDERWANDYSVFWSNNFTSRARSLGFPRLVFDPVTLTFSFDRDAANDWINDNQGLLVDWHQQSANFANTANALVPGTQDFFVPGTERFNEMFSAITSAKSNEEENGTRLFDRSALYHVHGEYKFEPIFTDEWIVGGNARLYRPDSDGTIFIDTGGIQISNFEVGAYTGIKKRILKDKVSISATARVDKNQNFNWVWTPAASLVYQPDAVNFLRVSFSSALRNPTLADQYLNLNVGRAILIGNLNGYENLITVNSLQNYFRTLNPADLEYFDVAPIRPEQVKTFELGYRTTLFEKLYVDLGYYYSIYDHFLGFNIGVEGAFGANGLPTSLQPYRISANSLNQVTTQGLSIGSNYYFWDKYMFTANYSWNRLNKMEEDDPIIPAFNTPEHKFNIGFSGRNLDFEFLGIHFKNAGFNVNYKWIEGFLFEGSPQFTGFVPTYDLVDAQINYNVEKWGTIFKLGASNLLNNMQFQAYGGPRIGRLAYFSITYDFKKK
jgi:iron complex outermembrane recepter protein